MPSFKSLIFKDEPVKFRSNFEDNVIIGYDYKRFSKPPHIGKNPHIRANSIIYNDVTIGNNLITGHNVLIRENTSIGDDVLIGTNSIIEGNTIIGNNCSIQSNVYIPKNTIIEDNVFIGPCAVFTNDRYPIRINYRLKGPVLRKGSSIGANSTFLSDIEVGEGAIVAAGAVVTRPVPPWFLAIGAPAKIKALPKKLQVANNI